MVEKGDPEITGDRRGVDLLVSGLVHVLFKYLYEPVISNPTALLVP